MLYNKLGKAPIIGEVYKIKKDGTILKVTKRGHLFDGITNSVALRDLLPTEVILLDRNEYPEYYV